jgi:hypothetical protein
MQGKRPPFLLPVRSHEGKSKEEPKQSRGGCMSLDQPEMQDAGTRAAACLSGDADGSSCLVMSCRAVGWVRFTLFFFTFLLSLSLVLSCFAKGGRTYILHKRLNGRPLGGGEGFRFSDGC